MNSGRWQAHALGRCILFNPTVNQCRPPSALPALPTPSGTAVPWAEASMPHSGQRKPWLKRVFARRAQTPVRAGNAALQAVAQTLVNGAEHRGEREAADAGAERPVLHPVHRFAYPSSQPAAAAKSSSREYWRAPKAAAGISLAQRHTRLVVEIKLPPVLPAAGGNHVSAAVAPERIHIRRGHSRWRHRSAHAVPHADVAPPTAESQHFRTPDRGEKAEFRCSPCRVGARPARTPPSAKTA